MDIIGLTMKVTTEPESKNRDVWLNFTSETGKHAMISIAALAERQGGVIGRALKDWASERIDEYDAEKIAEEEKREEELANGQFGVGA